MSEVKIWLAPKYLYDDYRKEIAVQSETGGKEKTIDWQGQDILSKKFFPKQGGLKIKIASRIEVPNEGNPTWVKTWYGECPVPEKGVVDPTVVDRLNIVKRVHMFLIWLLTTPPIRYAVPLFFLLPPKIQDSFIKKLIYQLGYISDWVLSAKYINFNYLCPAARALHDGMYNAVPEPETEHKNYTRRWFRFWVLFLEGDNLYRYKWQDIMGEMNREGMENNPRKEIVRLLTLGSEREVEGKSGARHKWERLATLANLFLMVRPKYGKIIGKFLADLPNSDLDDDDFYHASSQEDYDYRGMNFSMRQTWRENYEKSYI